MNARRRQRVWALAVLAASTGLAFWWLGSRPWHFAISLSDSVPHRGFLVDTRLQPRVGDYVEFRPPANRHHSGINFIKRVAAGPGDSVRCRGRAFYVGDRLVAVAKTRSQRGHWLALGPCGPVPPGHYFVVGSHRDSFDSRYGEIGHVPRAYIRGVARPLL